MKSQFQHIIIIIAGLLLWSCSTEKTDFAKLVAEWQGREIIFPEMMTDVLTGDTIDFSDADFTILTYVDSAGCTSCKMKLPLWNEFMLRVDSFMNVDVNLMYIVNTDDEESLSKTIECDGFRYPVIYDLTDEFNKTNHFPKQEILRTFILDASNKVIAMGNPVINPAIAQLYLDIITGNKLFDPNGLEFLEVDNAYINVGKINIGDTIRHIFSVHNTGKTPIVIDKVLTSCHCLDAQIDSPIIEPDKFIQVSVTFIGDTIFGDFDRNVQLYFEDINIPATLSIQGYVCN